MLSKRTKHTSVKLKVGDEIVVLAGREKGKRGKIMLINRKRNILVAQGVNLIRRFQRRTQENPQGGSLELESPLHLSNVAYYDPNSKKGRRLGFIQSKESKKKLRALREKGELHEIKEEA